MLTWDMPLVALPVKKKEINAKPNATQDKEDKIILRKNIPPDRQHSHKSALRMILKSKRM